MSILSTMELRLTRESFASHAEIDLTGRAESIATSDYHSSAEVEELITKRALKTYFTNLVAVLDASDVDVNDRVEMAKFIMEYAMDNGSTNRVLSRSTSVISNLFEDFHVNLNAELAKRAYHVLSAL